MMFTNVSGKFNEFAATIENEEDNFESAKINFTAETTSIDTNNPDWDTHLKSADFFDVVLYPKLLFVSTNIQKINKGSYQINGDLTIKNITKNIVLETEYSGLMTYPWGNAKIGLALSGIINRKVFDLLWNAALETGEVLVSEEIKLLAETQFIKQ